MLDTTLWLLVTFLAGFGTGGLTILSMYTSDKEKENVR